MGTGYLGDTIEVECQDCGECYEVEPDGLGEAGMEFVDAQMIEMEKNSWLPRRIWYHRDIIRGKPMSRIDVVPAEKGKFKVLVNFIQRGIEYSSKALAEHEADKIRNPKKDHEA